MTAASPEPVTPGQAAAPADTLTSLPRQWEAEAAATSDSDRANVYRDCASELGDVLVRLASHRDRLAATIRPKPVARVIPAAARELAEAMAETRRVRELVAEILGTYAGDTGKPGVLTSLATPDQRNRWRRRAGLGDPAAAEPLPRRTPGETRAAENAALGDWGKLIAERDQLRAELADEHVRAEDYKDERDQLRERLEAVRRLAGEWDAHHGSRNELVQAAAAVARAIIAVIDPAAAARDDREAQRRDAREEPF